MISLQAPELNELYQIYVPVIESRFPAFNSRPEDETISDIASILLGSAVDNINPDVLGMIVTAESFSNFTEHLGNHANDKGVVEHKANGGTVVYLTNHGQFTDIPVVGKAVGDIGLAEKSEISLVVSAMISQTELLGLVVPDELRKIGGLRQTIPRLDGYPSNELVQFRQDYNAKSVAAQAKFLENSGVEIATLVGRHDKLSGSGRTLYIHEPNQRTTEPLMNDDVLVVPVYVDCATFRPDGSFGPAEMYAEIFNPLTITDPKLDSRRMIELFKQATAHRKTGPEGNKPDRVQVRSWAVQRKPKKDSDNSN